MSHVQPFLKTVNSSPFICFCYESPIILIKYAFKNLHKRALLIIYANETHDNGVLRVIKYTLSTFQLRYRTHSILF